MQAKLTYALLASLFLLSACGSREEADARLARGCEAGIKVLLGKENYDRQINSVTGKKFDMSDGFRLVILETTTTNKEYGYESEEEFTCKFSETRSFGYLMWKAALIQVKIGDDIYGSEGGQVYGDMQDQLNLSAAVDAALQ